MALTFIQASVSMCSEKDSISFSSKLQDEIVARYPRKRFKEDFIQASFPRLCTQAGHATYGTVNAGVCERYIAGFKSPNACDLIAASPFQDSE